MKAALQLALPWLAVRNQFIDGEPKSLEHGLVNHDLEGLSEKIFYWMYG